MSVSGPIKGNTINLVSDDPSKGILYGADSYLTSSNTQQKIAYVPIIIDEDPNQYDYTFTLSFDNTGNASTYASIDSNGILTLMPGCSGDITITLGFVSK